MSDSSRPPVAVFDLDNTLADTARRQRFLKRRPRDWDAFFAAAPQDPPLARGIGLVRASAEECEIVCLTGRPERCRVATRWTGSPRTASPRGRCTCGATPTGGPPGAPSWRSCGGPPAPERYAAQEREGRT